MLADWITLNFPPWFSAFVVVYLILSYAFWPLTILAVCALVLALRVRKRAPKVVLIVVSALWALALLAKLSPAIDDAVRSAQLRSRQYTLTQATVIAGMSLPAGTVVTRAYDDPNGVESLDLKTPAVIGGLPVVGRVFLTGSQVNGEFTLARDATIGGLRCAAGTVARINELGSLAECTLAHPSIVKGVPCQGKIDLENGVACTLSREYTYRGFAWPQGTLANISDSQNGDFTVASNVPSMTVAGLALPQGANVNFSGTSLWINFTGRPLRYRDCDVTAITNVATPGGSFEATCAGTPARTVKLAAPVIGKR